MRYLIITLLGVLYWVGLMPASWAVSLLFVCSFLLREPGRNPRRGGSRRLAASPEPSLTTMFTSEATSTAGGSFSFSTAPGDESAGSGIPLTPPDPSRPGGPSFSGAVTVDHGESGAPRGSVGWAKRMAVCGHGCELARGHDGPHRALVAVIPASDGWVDPPGNWTGSLMEWSAVLYERGLT